MANISGVNNTTNLGALIYDQLNTLDQARINTTISTIQAAQTALGPNHTMQLSAPPGLLGATELPFIGLGYIGSGSINALKTTVTDTSLKGVGAYSYSTAQSSTSSQGDQSANINIAAQITHTLGGSNLQPKQPKSEPKQLKNEKVLPQITSLSSTLTADQQGSFKLSNSSIADISSGQITHLDATTTAKLAYSPFGDATARLTALDSSLHISSRVDYSTKIDNGDTQTSNAASNTLDVQRQLSFKGISDFGSSALVKLQQLSLTTTVDQSSKYSESGHAPAGMQSHSDSLFALTSQDAQYQGFLTRANASGTIDNLLLLSQGSGAALRGLERGATPDNLMLSATKVDAHGVLDARTGEELISNLLKGNDTIAGTADNDYMLAGYAGNDTIKGLAGNDHLNGGSGSDTLTGGIGADQIDAGKDFDRDVIVIAKGDSGLASGAIDMIYDFGPNDVLKLGKAATKANFVGVDGSGGSTVESALLVANQAFADNKKTAYVAVSDGNGNTFLFQNFNGDGNADQAISLVGVGVHDLQAGNIIA